MISRQRLPGTVGRRVKTVGAAASDESQVIYILVDLGHAPVCPVDTLALQLAPASSSDNAVTYHGLYAGSCCHFSAEGDDRQPATVLDGRSSSKKHVVICALLKKAADCLPYVLYNPVSWLPEFNKYDSIRS